ncbi:hypothetical protein, partial [Klebsiella pneumoniae]|uniref:hypothetical protein n=1 Tax=Klebsiella pneumoniae TaxID=573 RepID=UPI0027D82A52
AELHNRLPADWLLSAGLINGRNVWRADLTEKYAQIKDLVGKRSNGREIVANAFKIGSQQQLHLALQGVISRLKGLQPRWRQL